VIGPAFWRQKAGPFAFRIHSTDVPCRGGRAAARARAVVVERHRFGEARIPAAQTVCGSGHHVVLRRGNDRRGRGIRSAPSRRLSVVCIGVAVAA